MASTRIYHRSFGGGEIAPDMFGRIDDPHYQSGAAKLENFIARPQGIAENRPGFTVVRAVKDSTKKTRLIPFTYSTTQTMVIEIGAGYFRFHTEGQTVVIDPFDPVQKGTWSAATTYAIGDIAVGSNGKYYYCVQISTNNNPISSPLYWAETNNWYGPYEAYQNTNGTASYAESDLMDIHYVQSNDVLTLVHPNYPPKELRRYGANKWVCLPITFGGTLAAPTGVSVTASKGEAINVASTNAATPGVITTVTSHQFLIGNGVYVTGLTTAGLSDGFYTVNTTAGTPTNQLTLKNYNTGVALATTATTNTGSIQFGERIADITNFYVVTAYSQTTGGESAQSTAASATNNLYIQGSFNTISWSAVSGATRYNVYKRQNGLYGYIGQTNGTSFVDDNIAPDLSVTPPIYDTVFNSTGNYPGAVSYFEQRRIFAGTLNAPKNIWMTKSGTESDMSYSIPTQDDDRIALAVSSREANTIRHIVPLTQLLMLTSSAEWRVSPVNSDVITPSSVSVRPQSYVGANNVQPIIVNNSVVYCAARGGHVRELGYSWQASGFVTGDLSLRANHLFDNRTLLDCGFQKSPQQIIWFVSSTGALLGITYVPEQQIGAWHEHTTTGTFESVAVVAEGTEDVLYVIVKRTMDGQEYRFIERMASRLVTNRRQMVFSDHAYQVTSRNILNPNASNYQLSIDGGTAWDQTELLTMYSNDTGTNGVKFVPSFVSYPGQSSTGNVPARTCGVGNIISMFTDDNKECRFEIVAYINDSSCTVRPQQPVPVSLRNAPVSHWGTCFTQYTLSTEFSPGDDISVLIDGAPATTGWSFNGASKVMSIDHPCCDLVYGLRYNCNLQTLPMVMDTDAYGQGRMKNVNRVWLKIVRSSGILIGPDVDHLVETKIRTTEPYGEAPDFKTEEILIVIPPSWQNGGQLYIRQTDPLPLALVGFTAEVSIGG
jgi:hypothetical protein